MHKPQRERERERERITQKKQIYFELSNEKRDNEFKHVMFKRLMKVHE